jgi:ketosteroid isomerase-like protein
MPQCNSDDVISGSISGRAVVMAVCLFAAAVMAGSAFASDKTDVMRPVFQFVDAFNRDDLKSALGDCPAQSAIIDEFPPYLWQGATACADWSNDFNAYRQRNHITNPKITLGLVSYVDITGDRAYVVIPAHLTFKQNGKRVTERNPTLTLTLQKIADSWRIAGWAWANH